MLKNLPILDYKKTAKHIIVVMLLAGFLAVSCRKYESLEAKGNAKLLIFHAAPDAPAINVFVGNSETAVNPEPVSYTPRINAGSYRDIPSGNQTLTVKDVQGATIGVFQNALINYIANTQYSLFIIGSRSFRDRWRELTALPFYIDDILRATYPASGGRPAGDYNRDGFLNDLDRDGYAKEVYFLRMNTLTHIVNDNRSPRPSAQTTSVRFINGAPDELDLVPAGTSPTNGNPYGGSTHPFIARGFDAQISYDYNASLQAFVQMPAGQTLVFRLTNLPDAQLITIPGQELKGGKMYTIVTSGYYEPPVSGAPRLKYTLIEHN